jgi:hypothetical protein
VGERVAVITPTRLMGGMDVGAASLLAQGWPPDDLLWVVVDEWWGTRHAACEPYFDALPFHTQHLAGPPKREGMWNNLASAYNLGIEAGLAWDAEVFVSLQDYFWLPPNGIKLFAEMASMYPKDIVSGLASLSSDPHPDKVVDRDGAWTVYAEPWQWEKPSQIKWADVRELDGFGYPFTYTATGWELNWAAWPRYVVDAGVRFDPIYERGVAYDNQFFALRCIYDCGSRVWVDPRNHAIGLPHKAYWPEIEQAEMAVNNRDFHDRLCAERGWDPYLIVEL